MQWELWVDIWTIHFNASQCSLPGLFIYLLTTPTSCATSGHVQTIAYIKLPIVDEYGTLDMYSISSYVLGHISLVNLKWLAKGVLTGFAFCILNLSNTFSVYSPWDNVNLRFFLSLVILMPRIFFAAPKSLISNELDNFFLRIFISYILDTATSMSSTYNSKII